MMKMTKKTMINWLIQSMITYDNPTFHKFLTIFFSVGFVINGVVGIYTTNYGFIFNAIMLGILSLCCYKLFTIYKNIPKIISTVK